MSILNFLVYNQFKQKKWQRLSPKRRLKAFQKMEDILAKKMKRPIYTIIPKEWEDGTCGMCIYSKKIIYLNSHFLKDHFQFLGLATLFHEDRHAQQHFVVKTKQKFFRFSKSFKWKKNLEGYIKYEENDKYSYYSMQEIERDANRFAIKQLKSFRFRFRHESDYFDAINEKMKEYEITKENAKKELGLFYRLKLKLRGHKERKKNQ